MAKRLLIMALVAVQCASWSGASLFLCLGADGSVCIDGGPETCTCCHDEETGHACCDADEACGHHDECDSRGVNVPQLAADPCDCRHVQIAQTQAPSVVAKSVTKCAFERAGSFVLPTPVDRHTIAESCHDAARRPTRGGPPLAPSMLLTTVAVAVMNC